MDQFHFISYPHIETKELERDNIIILEKIDGANLGIGYIDEKTISVQSRNRILVIVRLEEDANEETILVKGKKGREYEVKITNLVLLRKAIEEKKFFKLEYIIDQLVRKVIAMRKELNQNFMLFGEIFGKPFPKGRGCIIYHSAESLELLHSEEVFYTAFDIILGKDQCLKHTEAVPIYENVKLPYLKQLNIEYKGNKILNDEVEKIQSHYSNNIVEGFILKKDETQSKYRRTITKIKRKAFTETTANKAFNVDNFITEVRLRNAYTKSGGNKEETIKYFIEDVEEAIIESMRNRIRKNAINFATITLESYE